MPCHKGKKLYPFVRVAPWWMTLAVISAVGSSAGTVCLASPARNCRDWCAASSSASFLARLDKCTALPSRIFGPSRLTRGPEGRVELADRTPHELTPLLDIGVFAARRPLAGALAILYPSTPLYAGLGP